MEKRRPISGTKSAKAIFSVRSSRVVDGAEESLSHL
jgi:hypothetical protein